MLQTAPRTGFKQTRLEPAHLQGSVAFLQHLIPSSRMVLAVLTEESKTEGKTYFVISRIDGQ